MSVHRLMNRPQRAQIAGGDFTSHLPQPSHFPLCRLIYSELALPIRHSSAWGEFFIPPSIRFFSDTFSCVARSNLFLDGMERSVWLIARPIRFATIFGFQFVSHGTYPFCHWAVLVTSLDFEAIKSALTDSTADRDDVQLGELWRISRREDGKGPLDNIRPFCVSNAKDEWSLFSAEYIGKTLKNDDEIEYEGPFSFSKF